MSNGAQVEMDWAGTDAGHDGAGVQHAGAGNGAARAAYLTDEEILGLEPIGSGAPTNHSVSPSPVEAGVNSARNLSLVEEGSPDTTQRDSSSPREAGAPRNDNAQMGSTGVAMPQWMQSAAADPRHGAEAQQLWREHQEFRAAFASPEEARAIKELLPGGVRDVLSLREATQSVERIDAALFSGDARAQADVVAELARANPAAFRSLFAEAAKVLVAGDSRLDAGQFNGDQKRGVILSEAKNLSDGAAGGEQSVPRDSSSPQRGGAPQNDSAVEVGARAANASSIQPPASNIQNFDPAAYSAFERSTNETVARDVRGSINDTLARVLPEGVADGAARRIGEDIFQEIHRALAADRTLSEQVATVLRDRRFGGAEQQRVASLLAGRARQLVPSVARRVIGEWTSSVLNTSRSKAARQAAAASRVDIAAPGGSRDSMPLRQMNPREVDYAAMSDEDILGM